MKRADALKQYFGTKDKPVTTRELLEFQFRKADMKGFAELAQDAAKMLGEELES